MRALMLASLLGAVVFPALGVNFSGKWALEMPGRGGRGGAPVILVLNHVGKEVTGTITARSDLGTGSPVNTEVLGGVVEGDTITFYVWTGTDRPVKAIYSGKASGEDTIELTITTAQGRGAGASTGRGTSTPQRVTARRVN